MKPNTLLYDQAAADHDLVPADCFVIGARGCLVRMVWSSDPRVAAVARQDATIVVDSFAEAVDRILRTLPRK